MNINQIEKHVFDALYDGVLIADRSYTVVYANPSYTRITKVSLEDIIGKSLLEVRPGARLPSVIDSGKQILGARRTVNDIEYIVNMVPIVENDIVIGGISILNEINDIVKLTEQLNQSHQKIKKLEKHVKTLGSAKYTFDDIVSISDNSRGSKKLAQKVATTHSNVLIYGESGTGKELYAQAIHNASERREGPFVAINCAIFDHQLLESELFGYEEGAFTGAKRGGKLGLFEIAEGGTLLLDEISEMSYALQARLLRVLQERVIRRIGGVVEIPINVRIISATNKDLEHMVHENTFRKDLYYRLSVFPINLFPLRQRREDIVELQTYFLNEMSQRLGHHVEISPEVHQIFMKYAWHGNIRELKNVLEFACNLIEGPLIEPEHLPARIQREAIKYKLMEIKPLNQMMRELELREIRKALLTFGETLEGKKIAAKALGISLATLYNKLKDENI